LKSVQSLMGDTQPKLNGTWRPEARRGRERANAGGSVARWLAQVRKKLNEVRT
jgi:hypothetical protein